LAVNIEHLGEYSIKVNEKDQLVYLQSPLSGINKYYFDTANEKWISSRDKHIMDELVVRELVKHCQGMLNL